MKIDICVNKGCGAVHLDPGELESIEACLGAVHKVRRAVSNLFK